MDDNEEYQELIKAEAAEERDTKTVMRTFNILIILIVIGILIAATGRIAHLIDLNVLPWPRGIFTEPSIIEKNTP